MSQRTTPVPTTAAAAPVPNLTRLNQVLAAGAEVGAGLDLLRGTLLPHDLAATLRKATFAYKVDAPFSTYFVFDLGKLPWPKEHPEALEDSNSKKKKRWWFEIDGIGFQVTIRDGSERQLELSTADWSWKIPSLTMAKRGDRPFSASKITLRKEPVKVYRHDDPVAQAVARMRGMGP